MLLPEMTPPEVTSPEEALTGNDITRTHGTGSHVSHGSDRMRNRFLRFFLTIVVVQNVSLRITDIATGSDVTEDYVTPKGGSLGRLRPCTTGSCSISALGWPFLWK